MENVEFKVCTKCGEPKSLDEFAKSWECKNGLKPHCKECNNKSSKKYYLDNEEKLKENRKRRETSLYKRELNLKHKYGMTVEDYNKMFYEQDGCCAICKRHQSEFKRPLNVDHNHETGKVRGLLCNTCNQAIGMLLDSIETLESAIEYLEHFNVESELPN